MQQTGMPSDKISVINESIDLQEFNPQQQGAYLRKEFGLDEKDTVIINIGMIRDDKGQCYFLEAANLLLKQNPALKFFLIGESAGNMKLENELRAKIAEYGIEKISS